MRSYDNFVKWSLTSLKGHSLSVSFLTYMLMNIALTSFFVFPQRDKLHWIGSHIWSLNWVMWSYRSAFDSSMLWFFTDLHCVCETNTHSREEVSYTLCSVPVITSPLSAPTQHWQVHILGNISKEGMKVLDSYVKHAAAGLLQYICRYLSAHCL